MALNIKNAAVERLVSEVAAMTGETKTEVIRKAVEERRARLALHAAPADRVAALLRLLEREVWPQVPAALLGTGIPEDDQDAILGNGVEGA